MSFRISLLRLSNSNVAAKLLFDLLNFSGIQQHQVAQRFESLNFDLHELYSHSGVIHTPYPSQYPDAGGISTLTQKQPQLTFSPY